MDKNKNEELQSRREFFKSAAKAALPVLGAVLISSIPVLKAEATTNCYDGGCLDVCSNDCSTSCKGECRYGCQGSCYGGCQGSCSGRCQGSCAYNCGASSYMPG